jgi:predicted transcriptional regulator
VELASVTLAEVLSLIEGRLVSTNAELTQEVSMACGADLMSDVLAFTHAGTLLLTGLTNPQVIRTAEMAGISAIVFVRGKWPPPETIALAQDKGIPLLASKLTMYETCGRLYQAKLASCGLFPLASGSWPEESTPSPSQSV